MTGYATNPKLRFPHHTFAANEPRGKTFLISSKMASPVTNPQANDFQQIAKSLRDAGVTRILLVHGTFAGHDVIGIVREIARFSPISATRLQELSKSWIDDLAGEMGNYTAAFADQISTLVNTGHKTQIRVERFGWSGENHHLGRADGAMRLLDDLSSSESEGRILVLAHSHGGNLMAMLSLIAGASPELTQGFFDATRMHYHSHLRSKIDLAFWDHVRNQLTNSSFTCPPIDVATFGSPLRYRWNREVCPKLLHFIQHRPLIDTSPTRSVMPRSIQDATTAAGGDYVQHIGIAGTDFLPSIFAWRDWIVEKRMGWLFESTARRRDVWTKLKQGRRESSDGTTLLVDYPSTAANLNQKLLGHGVYTCQPWLVFHLQSICHHFYSQCNSD